MGHVLELKNLTSLSPMHPNKDSQKHIKVVVVMKCKLDGIL